MTFSDCIRDFSLYLSLQRGLSPNTVEAYSRDVRQMSEYFPDKEPADITAADLHDFLASLYDFGLSQASRARVIASLRSFFKYLHSEGSVPENPTLLIESPGHDRTLPDVLSVEEIDRMIAAIPPEKNESARNRAIIEMLYGSGLRVSELCDLRISRFSARDAMAIIEGKGAKQRLVPISPGAID